MDDTNGESLTKARNEMCQKAFNVSDGKMRSIFWVALIFIYLADLDTAFTQTVLSFNLKVPDHCILLLRQFILTL